MAKLQITPSFMNSYEAAYNVLKNNPKYNQWFDEGSWANMAQKGDLDMYISTVTKAATDIQDYESFYDNWNLDYADAETKFDAMYTELFMDRTNVNEKRERIKTDENGIPFTSNGELVYEEYEASDYDYYRSIILDKNEQNYLEFLAQQERERKDSMSSFAKHMATIAATGTEVVYGAAEQFDDLFNFIGTIGVATTEALKGENFFDAWTESSASGLGRIFEEAGLQDAIIDFERRYSYMRDIDTGNYTTVGKYIGGVASTVGQMIPSMIIGNVAGGIAGAAGAASGTANTIGKVLSQVTFYTPMTQANIREAYEQFSHEYCSPTSAQIIANSTLKTVMQVGVEHILRRVMGGTALDNTVFGTDMKVTGLPITGKTVAEAAKELGKKGWLRIGKDFLQEGLEETFQDTSDFLVDRMFTVVNKNFGELSELTFQTLFDAFVIGGISSFAGSVKQVVSTKKVDTGIFKDKEGKETIKLGKVASYEYGVTYQTFLNNFRDIIEEGKRLSLGEASQRQFDKWAKQFEEMYATMRILASVHAEIGPERSKAANDLLTKIQDSIDNRTFDKTQASKRANEVAEYMAEIVGEDFVKLRGITKLAKEIEDEQIENITGAVMQGKEVDVETSQELKNEANALMEEYKDVKGLVFTDGKKTKELKDENGNITLVTPSNLANNGGKNVIVDSAVEMRLVEAIATSNFRGFVLEDLVDYYNKFASIKDVSTEDAITNLLFNKDFTQFVVHNANKDMFKFVAALERIEKIVEQNFKKSSMDDKYLEKIATSRKNVNAALYEYVLNNPFIDYAYDTIFNSAQRRQIAEARYLFDVYGKVTQGKKLTDREQNLLELRIKNSTLDEASKQTALVNIKSNSQAIRKDTMDNLNKAYNRIFTSKYDGVTYMPDTSLVNRVFNAFLQKNSLTLSTLFRADDATKQIITKFFENEGGFTEQNAIRFRQEQFKQHTNGMFEFQLTTDGKVQLIASNNRKYWKLVGYQYEVMPDGTVGDTFAIRSDKHNKYVKNLLADYIDDVTAATVDIDDVINDPNLLNEKIKNDIRKEYGDLTPITAFVYLKKYFINNYENLSLGIDSEGRHVFVNYTEAEKVYTKDAAAKLKAVLNEDGTINASKLRELKISDLIDKKYLYGSLKDIKIISDATDTAYAEYDYSENTLNIAPNQKDVNLTFLRFCILHEFQHAMQYENRLNNGYSLHIVERLTAKDAKKLLAEVKKYAPEIFEGKNEFEQYQELNKFLYSSTGETQAMGHEGSIEHTMYPIRIFNNTLYTAFGSYKLNIQLPSGWITEPLLRYTAIFSNIFNEQINKAGIKDMTGLTKLSSTYALSLEDLMQMTEGKDAVLTQKFIEELIKANSKDFLDKDFQTYKSYNPKATREEYANTKVPLLFFQLDDETSDPDILRVIPYQQDIGKALNKYINQKREFATTSFDGTITIAMVARKHIGYLGEDAYVDANAFYAETPLYTDDIYATDYIYKTNQGPVVKSEFSVLKNDDEPIIKSELAVKSKLKEKTKKKEDINLDNFVHKSVDVKYTTRKGFHNNIFENNLDAYNKLLEESNEINTAINKAAKHSTKNNVNDLSKTLKDDSKLRTESRKTIYRALDVEKPYKDFVNDKIQVLYIEQGTKLKQGDIKFVRLLTKTDDIKKIVDEFFANKHGKQKNYKYTLTVADVPVRNVQGLNPTQKNGIIVPSKSIRDGKHIIIQQKESDGKVVYNQVTKTDSRYVSEKKYAGTNLEKYNYIGKELSEGAKNFINEATPQAVGKDLWKIITERNFSERLALQLFSKMDKVPESLFKLYNKHFFKNPYITSFEQLNEYETNTIQYYALRAVLKSTEWGRQLLDLKMSNKFDQLLDMIRKDSQLSKLYDNIMARYYTIGRKYDKDGNIIKEGNTFDVNDAATRLRWMWSFDGDIRTAGYVGSIAKIQGVAGWLMGNDISLDKLLTSKDGSEDGDSLGDILVVDRTDITELLSTPRKQLILEMQTASKNEYLAILQSGGDYKKARELMEENQKRWEDMSDEEFYKEYNKIVKGLSDEELQHRFLEIEFLNQLQKISKGKAKVSQEALSSMTKEQMIEKLKKAKIIADKIAKTARTPKNVVNNIRNNKVNQLKRVLPKKEWALFVSKNSTLFDEDFNLRDEVLHNKDGTYRDYDVLIKVEKQLTELLRDARKGKYQSAVRFKADESIRKLLEKKDKQIQAQQVKIAKLEATRIIYNVADDEIIVNAKKDLPEALKKILAYNFKETRQSKTQYLTDKDSRHVVMNAHSFIEDNADLLTNLTQQDVNEIIEFYETSELLPSTNKARQYTSVQLYLMGYLYENRTSGRYLLTEQQANFLKERFEFMYSMSGAVLGTGKAILPKFKPEEHIAAAFAKKCGLIGKIDLEQFTSEIGRLRNAAETGDVEKIKKVKEEVYNSIKKQYSGRKRTLLDKLLKWERMMMLSGPGTWVRNIVSNEMVSHLNDAAEKVSKPLTKLLESLFPKKFYHRDFEYETDAKGNKHLKKVGQYKIIGTEVSEKYRKFIKEEIVDKHVFDLVSDGLTKYDPRKHKMVGTERKDALTDLLVDSIRGKLEASLDGYTANKVYEFIMEKLSDEKWITKKAIVYLGKIMQEDNVVIEHELDPSNKYALSTDVINHIADAYVLAAQDYMHSSNIFHKLENLIYQNAGPGWHAAYKQILPFATTSWNWFVEGLNYTPVGLAKAIIDYAKLENSIERLENKRQKGEKTVNPRFTEYLVKRNIGKGAIGTVGWFIGTLAFILGIAGIDEDDKYQKYKLRIGDTFIDISELFGTQGILLGIAMASSVSSISDNVKKGDTEAAFKALGSLITETVDTMLTDSVFDSLYNTFRYSESFGASVVNTPMTVLNMFFPNFLKTVTSITTIADVQYSNGVIGQLEKIFARTVPFVAYAFPKQYDVYTGEMQLKHVSQIAETILNKLTPLGITHYAVSENEKEAIAMGVKKGSLSGKYTINDENVNMSRKQITELNKYYGELNKSSLDSLFSGKLKYRVLDEKTNKYVELSYAKMTDKQKAATINSIMLKNSGYAKVYMLTKDGKYKYYAKASEYEELRKLGLIVYKSTGKFDGFVKAS